MQNQGNIYNPTAHLYLILKITVDGAASLLTDAEARTVNDKAITHERENESNKCIARCDLVALHAQCCRSIDE